MNHEDYIEQYAGNWATIYTNLLIGRPMKVGKEELCGIAAAVEWSLRQDFEAMARRYEDDVRTVIDTIGGSSVLTQAAIPITLRRTLINGFFVSVRNVNTQQITNLQLRVLVIVPVTPSTLASRSRAMVPMNTPRSRTAIAYCRSSTK